MRPITALGLFSLIPVPPKDIDRKAASGAMAAMPFVGLLLGALAGAVVWAGAAVGTAWVGALGGLAVLAALTGGLHLDGVADTADGLGSRKPAAEALAIMKQSDIGPMGVITMVLVLLLQAGAIIDLTTAYAPLQAGAAVTLATAVGRTGCLFASRGPSARPGGFGALIAGTPSRFAVAANAVGVLLLAGALGWWVCDAVGAAALAGAVACAYAVGYGWARHVIRRLGGSTGDVFGSVIEITQTAALVGLAVAGHALA
ncbi:adenosylcobinamide-GDP ribazoletransferase [uncultured Tessaracoccus sp.]|uniref:adenosylcobinamide-GDP ribazoletransferase n=1 Tax=uncultured Tessaracoccus sp. TaxID=905023 RepID=UPI002624F72A|nr:adenosylcobinamide-GDP ribazoletransferase [uncultured Tessaracoccus sp.]